MPGRKKKLPTKPRFTYVRQRAYELLVELGIDRFPVDPRQIIGCFSKWYLLGWFELKLNTGIEDPYSLDRDGAEAKTQTIRGSGEYVIVYDERVDSAQRIRWTIAHEIGHIVLGHLVHFEATSVARGGLTQDEYGILEVEAHLFAAELLAPQTIIGRFDFKDNPQGISLICDISRDAAIKRLEQIRKPSYSYLPTETVILRNFYAHLIECDFYQGAHNAALRFCPSSIYSILCRDCRICDSCHSFVTDGDFRFCPNCGTKVQAPDVYSPYTSHKGTIMGCISDINKQIYKQGHHNYHLPVMDGHLVFCPICYQQCDLSNYTCICGAALINKCTVEGRMLCEENRFCPHCGAIATFKELYDRLPERLNSNNVDIPKELDDYISCEFWRFIVMTIGSWEKDTSTYSALEDSYAIYNSEDMVIFVRNLELKIKADRGITTILKCSKNNGYLPVTRVTVKVAKLLAEVKLRGDASLAQN